MCRNQLEFGANIENFNSDKSDIFLFLNLGFQKCIASIRFKKIHKGYWKLKIIIKKMERLNLEKKIIIIDLKGVNFGVTQSAT